jgi:hypothetical protein
MRLEFPVTRVNGNTIVPHSSLITRNTLDFDCDYDYYLYYLYYLFYLFYLYYSCAIARAGLTMLSIIPYSSASCASKYLFLCRSYATLSYGCPVELANIISM